MLISSLILIYDSRFSLIWNGQSNVAPSSYSVYLQIYNRTLDEWETLDTESSVAVNTDFDLTASISASLSDYYDASSWIACRVYQPMTS